MKLKESSELAQSGIKFTRHRQQVYDLLKKNDQPVSAEQVYNELSLSNISINLSTVYRILDALSEGELVTKLNISTDNKTLYEYNCNAHRHYLVCLNCNKIFTIKNCPLGDYEKEVQKDTGFCITGHKLTLYGYCAECAGKEGK